MSAGREMGGVGRHLLGGGEPARPVGLQNVLVQRAKMLELLACRISLSARQGKEGDRACFVFEPNVINFEPGELRRFVARRGAGDDVDAELLGRAFEPGSNVDLVAERRIVEALIGSHVADAAFAGVEANAEFHLVNGAPGLFTARLPFVVEPVQRLAHVERGTHRVEPVGRIVDRRVPEGHDCVAHIFVDSAELLQDDIGHRRQIFVEKG